MDFDNALQGGSTAAALAAIPIATVATMQRPTSFRANEPAPVVKDGPKTTQKLVSIAEYTLVSANEPTAGVKAPPAKPEHVDEDKVPLSQMFRNATVHASKSDNVSFYSFFNVSFFFSECSLGCTYLDAGCNMLFIWSNNNSSANAGQTRVCANVEEAPSAGVYRIPGGISGRSRDSIWQIEINRQLALIVERVDRLEYAIGSVAVGVANIKGQMECKGSIVGEYGKVRAFNNDARVEAVAASNATGGQQCVSHKNFADPVDEDTTPMRL